MRFGCAGYVVVENGSSVTIFKGEEQVWAGNVMTDGREFSEFWNDLGINYLPTPLDPPKQRKQTYEEKPFRSNRERPWEVWGKNRR